jgi:hypothetical protein
VDTILSLHQRPPAVPILCSRRLWYTATEALFESCALR